jgi:hypothetical protein
MRALAAKARLIVANLADKRTHPKTRMQSQLVVMQCAQRARISEPEALRRIKELGRA